jgi:hypothetical protein
MSSGISRQVTRLMVSRSIGSIACGAAAAVTILVASLPIHSGERGSHYQSVN